MPSITQQPAALGLMGVASNPFSLLLTFTITDAENNPVPWSDVSSPTVAVTNRYGASFSGAVPTLTEPSSGEILLAWSATQTALLGGGFGARWVLSLTLSGDGPVAVIAGGLSMGSETSPGSSTSTSESINVNVGTNNVAISASIGAAAGLASPAFTGIPTAPTAASGTDTAQLATTAFVTGQMGVPGGLAQINTPGDVSGGFWPITGLVGVPSIPSGTQYAVVSATATTISVLGNPWTTNEWLFYPISVISGTGANQTIVYVTTNTSNTLTVSTMAVTCDNTSTVQIGFDQNYNSMAAAFAKGGVARGFPGTQGGAYMLPDGAFEFPYGLPPFFNEENVWGHGVGTLIYIPPSYSLPYAAIQTGSRSTLQFCTVQGPGGMSIGNAGTNRVRGIGQVGGGANVSNVIISQFFVAISDPGNHNSCSYVDVSDCFYGLAWERYGTAVPTQANNDLHNVNLAGQYFAGMATSNLNGAFSWRGSASHTGACPYSLIATDYIDEQTGLPANFQFSTLSATSTSVTVGPAGTPITFQNNLAGRVIHIVSGTSAGSLMTVTSSTGATITGTGGWSAGTPDNTSVFEMGFQVVSATSTTATFAAGTFDAAHFPSGQMVGLEVKIIAGTSSGGSNFSVVTANSTNVVTVASWIAEPGATSVVQFVRNQPAYDTCQIYDNLSAEVPSNAVFQEFSANPGISNISMLTCDFMIGCAMGYTPVVGLPSGYAWDINAMQDTIIRVPDGFLLEGGLVQPTAFLRSRNPSTGSALQSLATLFTGDAPPAFDSASNSDGIVFTTNNPANWGVSKKLSGSVAAGEPVEFDQSATNEVIRYAGGNFYGYAAAASTGGVVPVVRQAIGGTNYGFPALVASLNNTGYRLVPTAGTPGYFTASSADATGSISAFSQFTQSSGTPTLTPLELR